MNETVLLETIKTRLDTLIETCNAARSARETFDEAVKAVAEAAHCDAAVLKKFVQARCSDDPRKVRVKSAQLELLFSEVGE